MTTETPPPADAPAPEKPVPPPIDLMIQATMGHLSAAIIGLWGEFGTRGRGLRIDPSGLCRLGNIFGWLATLAVTDRPHAETLAADLFDELDYLANYGGMVQGEQQVPQYLVRLYDDGTFGGFSLMWYVAVPRDRTEAHPEIQCMAAYDQSFGLPGYNYRYVYDHNGSLLYFNAGDTGVGGPNFSVRFGEKLNAGWSIHT